MEISIKPIPGTPIYVVRSRCGRDRKRVFLAFRYPKIEENTAPHGSFPTLYTVNGVLHPVECPKKKHLAHLQIIDSLDDTTAHALLSGYSNKMVAEIIQKYDTYGEFFQKREISENGY